MNDSNIETPANKEIKYLRFLNDTLQAKVLRQEVCEEFARKIFDYLNGEHHFDAQIFCSLLYTFIFKCKRYQFVVMRSSNPIDKMRLERMPQELWLFLDSPIIKFALSSIDSNLFYGVSLEEKLKHLIQKDEPTLKTPRVEIILPEVSGNAGFISYVDIEFTLPRLSIEQKFDLIHFTICALNYLSKSDEPKIIHSNTSGFSTVYVATPDQFKVISDILHQLRNSIISEIISKNEGFEDDLEFDENSPEIARILVAQNQESKNEKQWLNKSSSVFRQTKPEIEEINLDEKLKITLSARQWLIALRFFINHYDLRDVDVSAFARLLAVMNGGKNMQNFRRDLGNERGLITAKTREDAKEVANLCRDVGLSKIADEIERAISRIKPNNL